jgi:hypothetical protein
MNWQFNFMNIDRKGILMEDYSGTLLKTEGEAPQTTIIPSGRFIGTADKMARLAAAEGWGITKYYEKVFSKKDVFPPHRYLMPYTNALMRKLGMDVWHVLERDEIRNADTNKAHPESVDNLKGYSLDEQEAQDLEKIRDRFSIVGGSGVLYEDRLAAFAVMGESRALMDAAVFRDHLLLDTGLEGKYAGSKYFKAKYPQIPLVARDDCKLTALVLTGVADSVSLVKDEANPNLPWDDLQVLMDRLPDYIKVNPKRLHYGRLEKALIS